MTTRYEDTLEAAIAAIRGGEPLEEVLGRTPEHADALREDLRLVAAVRNYAGAVTPAPTARDNANQRLMAALQGERTAPASRPAPRRSWWNLPLPRFAIAAVVVVVAFVAFSAFDGGDGTTVEAATIEGVVLENDGGSLTVQTLDALEKVTVPKNAAVSDAAGTSIDLKGIAPGEVVVIHAQRKGDNVVAQQVARLVANIESWCNDASDRCEVLTDRLQDLERSCQDRPVTCRVAMQEINQLRMRAAKTAQLELLKKRCRAGGPFGCEELAGFCQDHADLCGNIAPLIPSPTTEVKERIRQLLQSCQAGEALACRQLARLCQDNPGVCPTPPTRPNPNTSISEPTATPVTRSPAGAPTATPSIKRSAAPTATPIARRTDAPTATPLPQREPTTTNRTR